VSVYSALLAPYHEQLIHAATAYVVDVVTDGPPAAPRQGPAFPADVADCLARGLQGFPRVALVSSRLDPRIPLVSSGGPIPRIKDGFTAVFGPVPPDGGETQVSIDTGGGFGGRGGVYCITSTSDANAKATPCGPQWIS
jgi:hypothetical protein